MDVDDGGLGGYRQAGDVHRHHCQQTKVRGNTAARHQPTVQNVWVETSCIHLGQKIETS